MTRTSYIAFEGIDGAGKSEQIAALADRLRKLDLTPIELFEPTNGRYGRRMRQYIARNEAPEVHKQVRLFTDDRRQHVLTRIKPLLRLMKRHNHFVILQHRYYLSAPAYQSNDAEGMSALLRSQQAIAPKPDVVILLDVPAEVAIRRLRRRQRKLGSYDVPEALKAIRKRYLTLSAEGSEPICLINGVGSIERVHERIWAVLRSKLARPT